MASATLIALFLLSALTLYAPSKVEFDDFKQGDKGLPVTISTIYPNTYIPEGAVSLSFEYTPLGVAPLEWTAVEGFPEGTLVKIRGYPNQINGSFYIRKSEFGPKNSYNLLFCRGLQGVRQGCDNVAIVKNDGNLLLAVTQDYPYVFHLEQYLSTSADA